MALCCSPGHAARAGAWMDGWEFLKHNDDASLPDFVSAQMLGMAIQGWALERGLPLQGIPAMPERRKYLPVFIMLLHRPYWRDRLEALAQSGLDNQDMLGTVQRACEAFGIKGQMVKALAQLAT